MKTSTYRHSRYHFRRRALSGVPCALSSDSGAAPGPEAVVPVRLAQSRIRPFTDAVRDPATGGRRRADRLGAVTCVIDSLRAQVGDPVRRRRRLGGC